MQVTVPHDLGRDGAQRANRSVTSVVWERRQLTRERLWIWRRGHAQQRGQVTHHGGRGEVRELT